MADKKVTITLGGSPSAPTWQLTGDLDGSGVLLVPQNEKIKIKWELATNAPGLSAPTFAQQSVNQVDGIVFTGGVEDPWAAGSAPTVTYEDNNTKAKIEDDNTATHNAVDKHYYQINVVWGGVLLNKDPEVDEQSSGG